MMKPDAPDHEASRLETLRSLDLLDTPPEERFDRITGLARRLSGVPIAHVSPVDEHRPWFKSREGTDVPETPRDLSFCAHAILRENALVVPDARFVDNPLVLQDPERHEPLQDLPRDADRGIYEKKRNRRRVPQGTNPGHRTSSRRPDSEDPR